MPASAGRKIWCIALSGSSYGGELFICQAAYFSAPAPVGSSCAGRPERYTRNLHRAASASMSLQEMGALFRIEYTPDMDERRTDGDC